MDISGLINTLITLISSISGVGPILAKIIPIILVASGIISGVIAAWHGLNGLILGLSKIPGLSVLSGIAVKVQSLDDEAEGFLNKWVIPILNRLSLIPIPQKAPSVAQAK